MNLSAEATGRPTYTIVSMQSATRSGLVYKTVVVERKTVDMSESDSNLLELVKMLREDRQRWESVCAKRDAELDAERAQRARDIAAERERYEQELAAERRRREANYQEQLTQMTEQMQLMRDLVRGQGAVANPREDHVDQLKLTKLTAAEDIEAYLKTFERMMEVYRVNKDRWAFKLAPQLTGRAQQAYAALNGEDAADYDEVKKAILRRYNISEETYRTRFRSEQRKEGEGYVELSLRQQDWLRKWMDNCGTLEAVMEKILIEQLLESMPTDLRIWVAERKPGSGREAAVLADDYLQARERAGKPTLPRSTYGKQKVETRKCHNCKQEGHLAWSCPRRSSPPEDEKEDTEKKPTGSGGKKDGFGRAVKCYNCGGQGHISSHCPDKALFCGGGTGRSEYRTGVVEDNEVRDILLDTGCSRTMVRRDLVPEDKICEGEVVGVRCAHGDTVLYPVGVVSLQVDDVKLQVKAAVSDTLPLSVLLGTDIPQLGELLEHNSCTVHSVGIEEAFVVTTRSQAKRREEEDSRLAQKEAIAGARPTPLGDDHSSVPRLQVGDANDGDAEEVLIGHELVEELSQQPTRVQPKATRRQKREKRHEFGLERARDQRRGDVPEMPVSSDQLKKLQQEDLTLTSVRKFSQGKTDIVQTGFFLRDWRCTAHPPTALPSPTCLPGYAAARAEGDDRARYH